MGRSFLLLSLALLATATRADGPEAPAEAGRSAVPARPGDRGLFLLRDGRTFHGVLASSDPGGDVIELASGAQVRFAPGSVIGRVDGGLAMAAEPAKESGVVRVFLRDGTTVDGRLLDRENGRLRIKITGGGLRTYDEAQVRLVLPLDDLREDRDPVDPARAFHLGTPTACAPGRGTYGVGATAAEPVRVTVGLADWLTLSAGATMPLYQGRVTPVGATLTATGSLRLTSWLGASGGLRTFAGRGSVTGLLFASVTAGSPSFHATLYAGPPVPASGRMGDFPSTVVSAAGRARLTPYAALMAEVWAAPRVERRVALGAVGIRIFGQRIAGDFGAMMSTRGTLAPWLALSWKDRWGSP